MLDLWCHSSFQARSLLPECVFLFLLRVRYVTSFCNLDENLTIPAVQHSVTSAMTVIFSGIHVSGLLFLSGYFLLQSWKFRQKAGPLGRELTKDSLTLSFVEAIQSGFQRLYRINYHRRQPRLMTHPRHLEANLSFKAFAFEKTSETDTEDSDSQAVWHALSDEKFLLDSTLTTSDSTLRSWVEPYVGKDEGVIRVPNSTQWTQTTRPGYFPVFPAGLGATVVQPLSAAPPRGAVSPDTVDENGTNESFHGPVPPYASQPPVTVIVPPHPPSISPPMKASTELSADSFLRRIAGRIRSVFISDRRPLTTPPGVDLSYHAPMPQQQTIPGPTQPYMCQGLPAPTPPQGCPVIPPPTPQAATWAPPMASEPAFQVSVSDILGRSPVDMSSRRSRSRSRSGVHLQRHTVQLEYGGDSQVKVVSRSASLASEIIEEMRLTPLRTPSPPPKRARRKLTRKRKVPQQPPPVTEPTNLPGHQSRENSPSEASPVKASGRLSLPFVHSLSQNGNDERDDVQSRTASRGRSPSIAIRSRSRSPEVIAVGVRCRYERRRSPSAMSLAPWRRCMPLRSKRSSLQGA